MIENINENINENISSSTCCKSNFNLQVSNPRISDYTNTNLIQKISGSHLESSVQRRHAGIGYRKVYSNPTFTSYQQMMNWLQFRGRNET